MTSPITEHDKNPETFSCMWCDRFVCYDPTYGWIHIGGGAYVEFCDCGWSDTKSGGFNECPKCKNRLIRTAHRAIKQ